MITLTQTETDKIADAFVEDHIREARLSGQIINEDHLRFRARQAFKAAIESEREACAEIARAWINPNAVIKNEIQMVAEKIARKIRARGGER